MRIKNLIFVALIKILIFSSISLASEKPWLCGNEIIQHIITNDKRNFEYNELRNDSGIHFSHIWNKENKLIIKRDQNNFPIINFSLFDNKNFIPNKTVIKKIGNKVTETLKDAVSDFKALMPSVLDLGNPNMADRHFQKLFQMYVSIYQ